MLQAYQFFSRLSKPALIHLLKKREQEGKEMPERLSERKAITDKKRPDGLLVWVHAASVGEAQSTLILIDRLLETHKDLCIMVTSGTLTSAEMLQGKLPARTFHQFYPLDHPAWVSRFLNHWTPDMVFWMESELWPNMLLELKNRAIPAVLVNARMSDNSYTKWQFFKNAARQVLQAFTLILTQNEQEAEKFQSLGHTMVIPTDNLKYSARPLGFDKKAFKDLQLAINNRPCWVFASTHADEERLACEAHERLKENIPDLLTVIVPRHPERRGDIQRATEDLRLQMVFRGFDQSLPDSETDIYIADTIGELGLFYRLCPIACIGRSFSKDGGGGHNPIEPAQLGCAVLHGPKVQYQQMLYDEMNLEGAAHRMRDLGELTSTLYLLFTNPDALRESQDEAKSFAEKKSGVIETVMKAIDPLVQNHLFTNNKAMPTAKAK